MRTGNSENRLSGSQPLAVARGGGYIQAIELFQQRMSL
jgi:hypothetical protein